MRSNEAFWLHRELEIVYELLKSNLNLVLAIVIYFYVYVEHNVVTIVKHL